MPTSSTAVATVSCKERFGCHEARYNNSPHCVLHFPSEEKTVDFTEALKKKLSDGKRDENFDFRGVWFPEKTNLSQYTFDGPADFASAVFNDKVDFSNTTFGKDADFTGATFNMKADANFCYAKFIAKAKFSDAVFKGIARFDSATFGAGGGTDFNRATFAERVVFESASFQDRVIFNASTFSKEVNFGHTIFADYVKFSGNGLFGDNSSLDLHSARIEKPEHVSFHTVRLRPQWFVNVDSRKLNFTSVRWDFRVTEEKVYGDTSESFSSPDALLAITYGQLAVNAEENNRFEEASRFRYMAQNKRRGELSHGFAFWTLGWWYGLASGYGERAWQAALVLVALWVLFASIFFFGQQDGRWWQASQTSVREGAPAARGQAREKETLRLLGFREALIYSAGVMTLQKPEPLPDNKRAKTLVLLGTVLGPVQAALLALAIRRKFMR